MKKIWEWILCHCLGDHDWTCAAIKGIKPNKYQLTQGVAGFYNYATMYCDRCGKISKLSLPWELK